MWKKKKKIIPIKKYDWPNGICLSVNAERYLVVKNGLYKFYDHDVFLSWNVHPIEVNESSVNHMIKMGTLGFRDGTILKEFTTGKYYIVSNNKRRNITDPHLFDILKSQGYQYFEVSDEQINIQQEGECLPIKM